MPSGRLLGNLCSVPLNVNGQANHQSEQDPLKRARCKLTKPAKYEEDEPGNLVIEVKCISRGNDDLNSILRSPLAKKSKLVRTDDKFELENDADFDEDIHMLTAEEDNIEEQKYDDAESVVKQLPLVIENLKKHGQFEIWKKFHEMLSENRFPMDNIAYLLFLDVVKWFGHENVVSMRYDEQVTKFWRIGYRLFHGRFLRFMSGPKHKGQVIFGQTSQGTFSPSESKINFAVPMRKVTDSSLSPLGPDAIRPGIIQPLLDKVSMLASEDKTYKICLDGKKINASTSGQSGDIDLFGFEREPTILAKRERLKRELCFTEETLEALQPYEDDMEIQSLLPTSSEVICTKLKGLITLLGKRLQDLRATKVSRQVSLQKFKAAAGDNWKKSTLCNVISAISAQLYDINNCIDRTTRLVDNICYFTAILSGSHSRFTLDTIVDLRQQSNYRHLNKIMDHKFEIDTFQFLQQKSEDWFRVRSKATVTGSTLNSALGLDTLKKQQEHYDSVKHGKEKAEPSAGIKERMDYGTANEIHAVATLVAKVLPVLFPNMTFTEVGCLQKEDNNITYVISPDGRCDETLADQNTPRTFAIEIKCPFPASLGSYKQPVYYSVPKYYIPQILSEMYALHAETLIFLCYSKESTVVMLAEFDEALWTLMQRETLNIFGNDSRPSKKSEGVQHLKDRISVYVEEKISFLGEFVSVRGVECTGKVSNIEEPYCIHGVVGAKIYDPHITIAGVKSSLCETKEVFNASYQLNRTKGSEFLCFLISDLDRMPCPTGIPPVPIAYGLKGYSLPTDTLRNMLEFVLSECVKSGLYVPVCSFDGQWARLTVRDRNNSPLTLFQLQKDVYQEVRKLTISNLVANICNKNVVRCSTLQEMKKFVHIECLDGITAGKKKIDDSLHASLSQSKMIKDWSEGKRKQSSAKNSSEEVGEIGVEIIDTLSSNDRVVLTEELLQEVVTCERQSNYCDGPANTSLDEIGESLQVAETLALNVNSETNTDQLCIQDESEPYVNDRTHMSLNNDDIVLMIDALRQSKSKKKWDMAPESFSRLFTNAESINKSFTKDELVSATKPVLQRLNSHNEGQDFNLKLSENKHKIVTKLSKILGDGSVQKEPVRKKSKNPPALSIIAKGVIAKLSKEILCSLYASYLFPHKQKQWYENNPFGEIINITGLPTQSTRWYSMPEFNDYIGNYLFMVLDSYHQLCGLRRLVCQHGIPLKGVRREAFVKVAMESETNGCQLSLAMVNDLIDKQNVAFACATFSERVSIALDNIGEHDTAAFCRLIDNWYRADDEPGLSALDRCKYRIQLKEWLLAGVSFDDFPPHGAYIKGIPTVLFEGLLTNIERKIQLYTFSKTGTYNVRSVGSLDIENFFGTFQDLDPKGSGVLRPDDIPAAISVAVELLDVKLDPNRGFEMETTRSKVYPTNMMSSLSNDAMTTSVDGGVWRDLTSVDPIDHAFDYPERAKRKPKRKSATVSKPHEPAKGCMPVRQHHRRDESKILPHVRRGLNLNDI
ncbi:hypothetical protein ScPMuIL_010263 [Solemya velum]